MIRFVLILIISGYFQCLCAQPSDDLVMHITMDECVSEDIIAPPKDVQTPGFILCTCGPEGNAFQFNGNGDRIVVRDTGDILPLAFTLSFYLRPPTANDRQTIASYAESCTGARGFFAYYDGSANIISVEFSESLGKRILLSGEITSDCWSHVLIERNGERHALHIDGVKVDEQNSDGFLDITSTGLLTFGFGPCVTSGFSDDFAGGLDEIRLYERTLRDFEIQSLIQSSNEILTRDTIIFLGDGFTPMVNSDCAFTFNWGPTNGVSDPRVREPFLSPQVTTTYGLTMEEIDCAVTDSLRVIVIDPEEIQCEELLLPSAFTPNDDGLNDTYFISNGFILDELIRFDILDRLGSIIFSTTDVNEGWDGTFRGEKVMPGVYVYRVRYVCEGEERKASGSFSVLR